MAENVCAVNSTKRCSKVAWLVLELHLPRGRKQPPSWSNGELSRRATLKSEQK